MKYCFNCGNELRDEAVVCPHCGCATEKYNNNKKTDDNSISALAIVGLVLSFLIPIAGLVCSIIAFKNAGVQGNGSSRTFALVGIIISSVVLGILLLYLSVWSFCFGTLFNLIYFN